MDKVQRQILKNQVEIMRYLSNQKDYIQERLQETSRILNPTKEKQPCCEMDGKCEESE